MTLNLEHIELMRTEFVDAETRRYFQSDMLWKISYKDRGRQPLYLALLLELQSWPCYHMALRMLNYIVQFYQQNNSRQYAADMHRQRLGFA